MTQDESASDEGAGKPGAIAATGAATSAGRDAEAHSRADVTSGRHGGRDVQSIDASGKSPPMWNLDR